MGIVQCSSERNESYLSSIILKRRLENKDTSRDKKIHNEFLEIIGKNQYKFEISEGENFISETIKTQIQEKRISRFKKWYRMCFEYQNKCNNSTLKRSPLVIESPNKLSNCETKSIIKLLDDKSLNSDYYSVINTKKSLFDKNSDRSARNPKSSSFISTIKSSNFNGKFLENEDFVNYNYTINQSEIGLRIFAINDKKLFLERLNKGPPESFRWIAWMIGCELCEKRNEDIYMKYLDHDLDPDIEIQIKKDLDRTLNWSLVQVNELIAKDCLFRVLKAYAAVDEEVTYCQGMNFIAGFLLIISDFSEVDTFYMMKNLFMSNSFEKNIGLRGLFAEGFPLLHLFLNVFNDLFERYIPKLKTHFQELEIPDDIWIGKWFQTLYTLILPIELLCRLWDCIISKGIDFLMSFSLSLLRKYEQNLLEFQDISDIVLFFQSFAMNSNPEVCEAIISDANENEVPQKLIEELKLKHEKNIAFQENQGQDPNSFQNQNKFRRLRNNFKILTEKNEDINTLKISLGKDIKYCKESLNPIRESRNFDDTSASVCSEIHTFENKRINEKIQDHILQTKAKPENVSGRSISIKPIKKTSLVKKYFDTGKIKYNSNKPFN